MSCCSKIFFITIILSFMVLIKPDLVYAQDNVSPDLIPRRSLAELDTAQQTTPDGFTVWRKEIQSGCSYSDHNYTLDIPVEPNAMSDISYTMTNYDVDYDNTQGCNGRPEVDHMNFNGNFLGILTGANNSWSTNSWSLGQSQVVSGTNEIYIDTDAPGTGCWCVGVGYIEVRAKMDFQITAFTPQNQDKNRNFHKDKLDLTVTFSANYDPSTLTDNTFKLEYKDQSGSSQQVPGSFIQLSPNKFRFDPSADLKDGIRYYVSVKSGSNGVKSQSGEELDDDREWAFWTVPNLDVNDNFDYGSGTTCGPKPAVSAPCNGLQLDVYQATRNADMVSGKLAVARLYLRWKKHDDVLDADQEKTIDVDGVRSRKSGYGKV